MTLVVPSQEASDFASLAASQNCDLRTYERDSDPVKWHLAAQCQKCLADVHCPDADFILHTDSDCIFTELVCPEDYFEDGKPVMVIKEYALIQNNPWRDVTQKSLKMNVKYSFMERHPQVNPRSVYPAMRNHVEFLHKMPFEKFMLSRKPTFPWGISEHNLIGAYAYRYLQPLYHWIDVGKEPIPHEKLRQFWSYGDIDKPQDSPHGEPRRTPIQVIKEILSQ